MNKQPKNRCKWLKYVAIFLITIIVYLVMLYQTAPIIPVMGFHAIVEQKNPDDIYFIQTKYKQMNYKKQDFEKLVESLINKKFWFITPQELHDYYVTKSKKIPRKYLGKKPIMLSFDDGYKNNYTNVIPVLEKMEKKYHQKVKVVLFVNPGTFGKSHGNIRTNITCQELRDGFQKGYYDLQSHGYSHKNLTELNDKELNFELAESQKQLKKCVQGLDVNNQVGNHIAYPFGASNQKVEKYAAKYYQSGYLYNSRMMKIGWVQDYQIPRLTINMNKSEQKLIEIAEKSKVVKQWS
ncbi:MAG TPA: polysaccharide deacetylase family protein [Allocoleopsis sp.]